MDTTKLIKSWLEEERSAQIHGWDFSHLDGRMISGDDDLPWSFPERIARYIKPTDRILDIDTGGGEFLLSLGHSPVLTSATESYPPNVELCRQTLTPLGIDFREVTDYAAMPFADGSFDLIINRHGSYDADELCRILKPNGIFLTQQVGSLNDRELVELLLPEAPIPFPENELAKQSELLRKAGFTLIEHDEAFRPISFTDTGALVWFTRVIPWEFPDFSVEKCFERLLAAEETVRRDGHIDGRIHRFYIAAQKR
ncbi:MAG: class I SAM-dependent methyltransferase [Ruminococcus sp.]|nr:class I SAM-dependent methyltransferase [Ruminococcus sp.]